MEHASTGAGADYNPVKRGMTNVLSCPRVQSQHFWDGLRKKKKRHIEANQALYHDLIYYL